MSLLLNMLSKLVIAFLPRSKHFLISSAVILETKKIKPLWPVARQAPLSMGFPRQEYWSGLPFPSPGHLPKSGLDDIVHPPLVVAWRKRLQFRENCSGHGGFLLWAWIHSQQLDYLPKLPVSLTTLELSYVKEE